jgi:hypothetical protein
LTIGGKTAGRRACITAKHYLRGTTRRIKVRRRIIIAVLSWIFGVLAIHVMPIDPPLRGSSLLLIISPAFFVITE